MSVGGWTDRIEDFLDIYSLIQKRGEEIKEWPVPEVKDIDCICIILKKGTGDFLYDTYSVGKPGNEKGYLIFISWHRKGPIGKYITGENCYYKNLIKTKEEADDLISKIIESPKNEIFNIKVFSYLDKER